MSSIQEALHGAVDALNSASDASALDAERLLLKVLQRDESSWLYAHGYDRLSPADSEQYEQLVAERVTGKPLAYLLGEQEFYGRSFTVTEHVLIPRPSTEHLIDAVLQRLDADPKPLVLADIGTGSGCIAITLLLERPEAIAQMYATDISVDALAVARENAARHGVLDRISWRSGDLLTPLADTSVDLIVSNPPYVPSAELIEPTTPETAGLRFEPRLALDGGPDGQAFARRFTSLTTPHIIETVGGRIVS